jgi:hypothetical protein
MIARGDCMYGIYVQMFKCSVSELVTCIDMYTDTVIPSTGRGGRCGSETPRLPHFLGSLFTDGGDAVSLTRRP